ncbi:phosphatidate cytidylyltransferase [Candidatus Phytoplasma fraxini]|uniref:Phosphatidate cytidylyltransferase n=1 Tax=Ash yellows phytoplasma TaxID=35780 RepID=A0ABZ2UBT8_ASHYP
MNYPKFNTKQKAIIKKIYVGIILFLSNLFVFYFVTNFDKENDTNIFIYLCLFFVLFILIGSIQEILKSTKLNKNKIVQVPYFLFSFLFFFLFISFLFSQVQNKSIFTKYPNITKTNLVELICLIQKDYFLFYFLFLFICLWFCFLFIRDFKTNDFNFILFILLYVVFSNACFLILIIFDSTWFLYLFVISIANDSFAFLGGILFGKHLLYPSVSPKKTWEGFFCGIIMTLIIVLFLFIEKTENPFFWMFTVCNCVISQIGDLISSKFKRDFAIKDFDNKIPGHGGLLDRFDSLLFLSFFVILFLTSPISNYI